MKTPSRLRVLLGLRGRGVSGEPLVAAIFLHGRRDFAVEARGTSRRQGALHDIVARQPLMRLRQDCIAELRIEPEARGDRHAVTVLIADVAVGQMPGHLATQYREWLQAWNLVGVEAHCRGMIINRAGSDPAGPRYGVRLDLEIPFKMTTMR